MLGRCLADPYLVHLHSHEYEKLDRHTFETYSETAERTRRVVVGDPASLGEPEKAHGIKWDPHGVLWDTEVFRRLQPPRCQYPDWMHHFCASGGLAQYELNGIVMELVAYGVTLEQIDRWIADVHVPNGMTKLKKTFFRDRVVQRAGRHIKAFASEVLSAVMLLVFFLGHCCTRCL
jgi:hypothetical protein